jgi:hypothetical protein
MHKIGRRTFIKNAAAATALGGAGSLIGAPAVWGQEAGWPTRPIKFIVPLAPGGSHQFHRARSASACRARSASRSWWESHRAGEYHRHGLRR